MKPLSFKRHRFPAAVIRHAVWLYFRFNLSCQSASKRDPLSACNRDPLVVCGMPVTSAPFAGLGA